MRMRHVIHTAWATRTSLAVLRRAGPDASAHAMLTHLVIA